MAILIHPGAIPAPFAPPKKGGFTFASQRKSVDYYATAVKTLEVRVASTLRLSINLKLKNVLDKSCHVDIRVYASFI